jgi:hypothetical protein
MIRYPLDEWDRDLGLWFSKEGDGSSSATAPRLTAYYLETQAVNPDREANCACMGAALAFLRVFLPDLVAAGAAVEDSSGAVILTPALVTALYRAFLSPVGARRPQAIDVALILQAVKQQKDYNEDRS